jgi:FkbM family methyltransferase
MQNYLAHATYRYGEIFFFRNDDPIGSCVHHFGEWAQQEMDLFDTILTETSNVLDVGANIGTHSLYFSKKCRRGAIIAIEPQLYIYEILCMNMVFNGCFNVLPVNAACGSKRDQMRMVNIDPFHGEKVNYGMFKVNSDTEAGIKTNMIPLDEYSYLDRFHMIKMDVEGYESTVLEGAKKLLKQHKPILYIEFNNKEGDDALLEQLNKLDYIPYWHGYTKFNPNNFNKQTKNVWEEEGYVPTVDNLDKRYETNIICYPKNETQPTGLKKAELGESITKLLFRDGLIT